MRQLLIVALALMLTAVAVNCQSYAFFDRVYSYTPGAGSQLFILNVTKSRYLEFQINTANESFPFVMRRLLADPFTASFPDNTTIIDLFEFAPLDSYHPLFNAIVTFRYSSSSSGSGGRSCSSSSSRKCAIAPVVYDSTANTWLFQGTSTSVYGSALISNLFNATGTDIYFGFVEQPIVTAAVSPASKIGFSLITLAVALATGICMAL